MPSDSHCLPGKNLCQVHLLQKNESECWFNHSLGFLFSFSVFLSSVTARAEGVLYGSHVCVLIKITHKTCDQGIILKLSQRSVLSVGRLTCVTHRLLLDANVV